MNSFQILDKDNKAVPINMLDEEAAAFWGKEPDKKYYASPTEYGNNWYDCIGWKIANKGSYFSGWHGIVHDLIADAMGSHFIEHSTEGYKDRPVKMAEFIPSEDGKTLSLSNEVETSIYATLEWVKPYVALINHWKEKGYQPKQIKE